MKFKVAAAVGTGLLCASVASCLSGPPGTASTQAPPVTVLTQGRGQRQRRHLPGPAKRRPVPSGPEIVSPAGKVLWFRRLPAGTFATDFRTQVVDGVVQEIDIKTGKLLFQWDSAGHVPYSDSHAPPPAPGQPWDWFHINAVHLDTDGNLLISSRFTRTIYKVNRRTGAMMWQLGGKHSTFAITAAPGQNLDRAGEIFAFQHDPEALGGGVYTVFDNESDGQQALYPFSRVVTIRLDQATGTATLIKSVNQPEGLTAAATGNAQTTRNGDLFVSWGGLSYFSEFSPSGKLLFNAKLPDGVATYRAYRLPWNPGS